jgi:hypothetical protein
MMDIELFNRNVNKLDEYANGDEFQRPIEWAYETLCRQQTEIESLRQQLAKPAVEPLLEALRKLESYLRDDRNDNRHWAIRDEIVNLIAAYDALEK